MTLIEKKAAENAIAKLMPSFTTPDGSGKLDEIIFYAQQMCASAIDAILELPTIDPVRTAGGCYCRECKFRGDPEKCPLLYFNQRELDEHDTDDTDSCSYGEPRAADD